MPSEIIVVRIDSYGNVQSSISEGEALRMGDRVLFRCGTPATISVTLDKTFDLTAVEGDDGNISVSNDNSSFTIDLRAGEYQADYFFAIKINGKNFLEIDVQARINP